MKLFYAQGACSLVVRIIINELALTCDYESVDLRAKRTESGQDFRTINPKGSVPTLALDNGKFLTENAVILQYLADESKATALLPPVGDFKRYQVLEWLNYITTELHKSIGALFNPKVTDEMKNSIYNPLIKSKLDFVNKHLQNHHYLVGDHFTLPDAYLFVMIRWVNHFKFDMSEYAYLNRYFDKLKQRASIHKSLTEEGL